MNKFSLFDFISKLSASKEAQTSLLNIIEKLFAANASKNALVNDDENSKNNNLNDNLKPNFKSDVYRSPSTYSLYSEMVEKHLKISREIDEKINLNNK